MNNDYDANDPFFKKFGEILKLSDELNERFKKIAEEIRSAESLAGNRLAKVIGDSFMVEKPDTERPNAKYGTKPEFVLVDDWAGFVDTFTRPKDELEKSEPVYDISWIRKRMKCCKNPMERKMLEKQLNAAYKARKKARNKND